MSKKIRINKYIASAGIASRRGADELIKEGKVKINGQVITEPGVLVDKNDKITVGNKKIELEEKEYYLFHKPAGFITTRDDPQDRKTIYDILPDKLKTMNPAGRLDKASSGLLILTNDGDLLQKLTHPSIKIPKVYRVTVEGKVGENDLRKLTKGIEIEQGQIAYAEAYLMEYKDKKTLLEITLYQGYNRQIRKMMDYLKFPIKSLKRISHAIFNISGLKKGEFRKITPKELQNLKKYLTVRQKQAVNISSF
jgi:23S rRNA pseudouridine2605 synthase